VNRPFAAARCTVRTVTPASSASSRVVIVRG
jgi:hypothetical protein